MFCIYVMYKILLLAAFVAVSHAYAEHFSNATGPMVVHPTPLDEVDRSTFTITSDNTLNTTDTGSAQAHAPNDNVAPLRIQLINRFRSGPVHVYVTGKDTNGAVFLLQRDGNRYYPPNPAPGSVPQRVTAPIAIPLGKYGSKKIIRIYDYIKVGRVYFAAGQIHFFVNYGDAGPQLVEPSVFNPSDPSAGISYGFAELTRNENGLYANLSYIDFVGMIYGMILKTRSGRVEKVKGLPYNAVVTICKALRRQAAKDGQAWDRLCVYNRSGKHLRVLNPEHVLQDGNFANYWTNYVNRVYQHYTTHNLRVDTAFGPQIGRVNPATGNLEFPYGGYFPSPTAGDIFGCNSGPFANVGDDIHKAIVPVLCAAFNRGTLLIKGGNFQPNGVKQSKYYTTRPSNQFSRIVHQLERNGRGYAFPYDDVTPKHGVDQSGTVADLQPQLLTFTVGRPAV